MQYYVYILYSEKLNKYYIGSTGNPEDRLRKHKPQQTWIYLKGKTVETGIQRDLRHKDKCAAAGKTTIKLEEPRKA